MSSYTSKKKRLVDCSGDARPSTTTTTTKGEQPTVEVIVKLKKRRRPKSEASTSSRSKGDRQEDRLTAKNFQDPLYKKGSWGDLLSANRNRKADESSDFAAADDTLEQCQLEKNRLRHKRGSTGCQKIYLTDNLYLETHTHINDKKPAMKPISRAEKTKKLEKENETLRKEVFRLQSDASHNNRSSDPSFRTSFPQTLKQGPPSRTQALSSSPRRPSFTSLNINSGGSKLQFTDSTKLKELERKDDKPDDQYLERLEKENAELKAKAAELAAAIDLASFEHNENLKTIERLVAYAEILDKEKKETLEGSEEQKQELELKLMKACSENQHLKKKIEEITKQSLKMNIHETSPADKHDKLRNVIKDVKSMISQEIQQVKSGVTTKHPIQNPFRGGRNIIRSCEAVKNVINLESCKDSFLSDSNASEIQQILKNQDDLNNILLSHEDRGSTQYLGLPLPSGNLSEPNNDVKMKTTKSFPMPVEPASDSSFISVE